MNSVNVLGHQVSGYLFLCWTVTRNGRGWINIKSKELRDKKKKIKKNTHRTNTYSDTPKARELVIRWVNNHVFWQVMENEKRHELKAVLMF